LLRRLRDTGIPADQICVISPFRMVAAKSFGLHEQVFPGVERDQRRQWVGTVHTMQGKEADVVILVLGGDPTHPGARRFATEEPNLLNVAVSRARRRLYVIGNRDFWGTQPYLDVLAARIPRWRPDPHGTLYGGPWSSARSRRTAARDATSRASEVFMITKGNTYYGT
jgi:hypothetical protein